MPNNKKKTNNKKKKGSPKVKGTANYGKTVNRRTPADYKRYRKSQKALKSRTKPVKTVTRTYLDVNKASKGAAGKMAKKSGGKGIKRGKKAK